MLATIHNGSTLALGALVLGTDTEVGAGQQRVNTEAVASRHRVGGYVSSALPAGSLLVSRYSLDGGTTWADCADAVAVAAGQVYGDEAAVPSEAQGAGVLWRVVARPGASVGVGASLRHVYLYWY